MEQVITREAQKERLFIGLEIPDQVKHQLREELSGYRKYVRRWIPSQRWHITLLFWGEVAERARYEEALLAPILTSHVPTVKLTHLGQGLRRGHIWAYAHRNHAWQQIYDELWRRVELYDIPMSGTHYPAFVPHIHVADLDDRSVKLGVPDRPIQLSFTARRAALLRSSVTEGARVYQPISYLPFHE